MKTGSDDQGSGCRRSHGSILTKTSPHWYRTLAFAIVAVSWIPSAAGWAPTRPATNDATSASAKELRHKFDKLEAAFGLINLAEADQEQGEHEKAKLLVERALPVVESFSPKNPMAGLVTLFLAEIHRSLGEHEEAEAVAERALRTFESALRPEDPVLVAFLDQVAGFRLDNGKHEAALDLHKRARKLEEEDVTRNILVAKDSHRLGYAATLLSSINLMLSFHLQAAPRNRTAAELALTTLLRNKGRARDLMAQSYAELRRVLTSEQHHLLDELSSIRARHAAWAARGPGGIAIAEYSKKLAALQDAQDELWIDLAKPNLAALLNTKPVTIEDIQAVLPVGSVLVELFRYIPQHADGRLRRDPGPPRYGAYLISTDHIDWVDLAPAAVIDQQVSAFRDALLRRHVIPTDLYDSVMAPVITRLGDERRLFIAPDAELNRVPFGAMYDGSEYLVEQYSLHYLTTGRDLLCPWDADRAIDEAVLVVANPLGADLPGTEREAQLLAELFPHVQILMHENATETRIRRRSRPWLLHMGAHGFYDEVRPERNLETVVAERLRSGKVDDDPIASGSVDNPMMKSGLRLADVEPTEGEDIVDDGLLTAYEVSGWDLRGTELVVLSACGTGLGAVHSGEGVMGLRRAFVIAGAHTQVMSLWDLDDQTTPKVMESYYRKLAAGVGRGEAMEQAQIELLRSEEYRHPKDWAAFVVVGDWTPLSGTLLRKRPTISDPRPEDHDSQGCQLSCTELPSDAISGLVIVPLLGPTRRRVSRGVGGS
jgi:CHAT domain-containing protein/tetratricopeptide (TPR) repeat protein